MSRLAVGRLERLEHFLLMGHLDASGSGGKLSSYYS